jgi:hypothetical protein
MEQYEESDTFENVEIWPTTRVESWPTIEEIERRLRKLGCTKEQVRRHLDQVAMSRIEAARENPRKQRPKAVDWP